MERLPTNPTVEHFFKLYITEEMIDHLVVQTNLYARQFLDKEKDNLKSHSRVHEWKPTDRAEMLTEILAILRLMGIVHKPRLPMYWSVDSILATPIFNQVMRRDRFLLLVRFSTLLTTPSTTQLILTKINFTRSEKVARYILLENHLVWMTALCYSRED